MTNIWGSIADLLQSISIFGLIFMNILHNRRIRELEANERLLAGLFEKSVKSNQEVVKKIQAIVRNFN